VDERVYGFDEVDEVLLDDEGQVSDDLVEEVSVEEGLQVVGNLIIIKFFIFFLLYL